MYRQVLDPLNKLFYSSWSPIILILGMRQVGKTTLANTLASGHEFVRFNFDIPSDALAFTNQDKHQLGFFAEKYAGKIIIVDEVQKYPQSTAIIKYLYDTYKIKFILTGSSEVKIRKSLGDSLAGRIHEVRLYPLSLQEINIQSDMKFDPQAKFNNYDENQQQLLKYLVYGSLPQLQNIPLNDYSTYLNDFTNNLISKDVLEISGTRKPSQVYLLAKLLALQIGQLINFNELANTTDMTRVSVYKYLDIFEQMGLIVKAQSISTNDREAISKAVKIYFTDLGVRNSLVGNFTDFSQRLDQGQLLENAVFVGIKRSNDYLQKQIKLGFFRSPHGSEIDIVEKDPHQERLFEIKVGEKNIRHGKNVNFITFSTAQQFLY